MAWKPTDVTSASLVCWLDASDDAYVTESGGQVTVLSDKSSTGADFTPVYAALGPNRDTGLSGLKYLNFDGITGASNEALGNTSDLTGITNGNNTVAVVGYLDSGPTTVEWGFGAYSAGATGKRLYGWLVDGTLSGDPFRARHGSTSASGGNWSNSGYAINIQTRDTSFKTYRNGTAEVSNTSDASWNDAVWVIGSLLGNNANATAAHIREILIFDGVLSTTDRQLVEGYLAWKWDNGTRTDYVDGLPSGHPYKSVPPPDDYTLTGNAITGSAPALDSPALSQDHAIAGADLTAGTPAFDAATIAQDHSLTGNAITGSAPILDNGTVSGGNVDLTGNGIDGAAPLIDVGTLAQDHGLVPTDLSTGPPVLDSPALTQDHALTGAAIDGAAPILDSGTLTADHSLTGNEITGAAPLLDSPDMSEAADLAGNAITGSAPVLDVGTLAQDHVLGANAITGSAPVLDAGGLTQDHVLTGDAITGSAPVLDSPVMAEEGDAIHEGTADGATAGTPGTLPTGWEVVPGSTATWSISAGDQDIDGVECFEITMSAGLLALVFPDGPRSEPTTAGETWKNDAYVQVVSGALSYMQLGFYFYDDLYTTGHNYSYPTVPGASDYSDCLVSSNTAVAGGYGTNSISGNIWLNATEETVVRISAKLIPGFVGDPITTGAPTIDSGTLTQDHALTGDAITTGAPTLDSPSLSQDHGIDGSDLTSGAPLLDSPALTQAHALTGDAIDVGAPLLDTPVMAEAGVISGDSITGSAPVLDSAVLSQDHVLTPDSITATAPLLDSPALGQDHALTGDAITGAAPTLDTSAVTVDHGLTGDDIVGGAPVMDTPSVSVIHALTGNDLTAGTPSIDPGSITQAHVIVANHITTGTPTLDVGELAQDSPLTGDAITTGAPILDTPTITSAPLPDPPAYRTETPDAQTRLALALVQDRTAATEAQDRTETVPAQDRTAAALSQLRTAYAEVQDRTATVPAQDGREAET